MSETFKYKEVDKEDYEKKIEKANKLIQESESFIIVAKDSEKGSKAMAGGKMNLINLFELNSHFSGVVENLTKSKIKMHFNED